MKLNRWLVLVALVLIVIAVASCDGSPNVKYTVWTEVDTYAAYQATMGTTLGDGMYVKIEIPNSEWRTISSKLTNEGKHRWTRDMIKDWLIGRGFGEYESTMESAWFSTIDHGMLFTRTGNLVYVIMK